MQNAYAGARGRNVIRSGSPFSAFFAPFRSGAKVQRMSAGDQLQSEIYPLHEAARLAQLPPIRLKRWFKGYDYTLKTGERRGERRRAKPLVPTRPDGPRLALNFMDFVEALYVRNFFEAGVSMRRVRLIHEEAEEEFKTAWPFARERFETEGRSIFRRFVEAGKQRLVDRYSNQLVEKKVFDPLMHHFDFDPTKAAARYWPLGREKPVFLDPHFSFGEAVVSKAFVPTRVVVQALGAGDSKSAVASWYGITRVELDAAIEYEESIRRPAA
jgi:uncharacterized protein (DUF433 family)